uniref:Uncharacterized protein n=1 Tax=Hyaloperonospora arabidopsidis (strain Emoy2) TaxID=559515 RepID=M4BDZ7_HYAAE
MGLLLAEFLGASQSWRPLTNCCRELMILREATAQWYQSSSVITLSLRGCIHLFKDLGLVLKVRERGLNLVFLIGLLLC